MRTTARWRNGSSMTASRCRASARGISPSVRGCRRRVSENRLSSDLALGTKIQHLGVDPHVAQALEQTVEIRQVVTRAAHVDHRRHPFDAVSELVAVEFLDQGRQQAHRQIVHGVVAQIFQCLQGDALARAGLAADENQAHASLMVSTRKRPINPAGSPRPA